MEVTGIRDRDSLLAWFEALPRGTEAEREQVRRWAMTIAHRAAMRALPSFWQWSIGKAAKEHNLTALPVLRCNLVSGVAVLSTSPEIKARAAVAYTATQAADKSYVDAYAAAYLPNAKVFAAAGHAVAASASTGAEVFVSAAASANSSATASSSLDLSAHESFWEVLRTDCNLLKGGDALRTRPLWSEDNAHIQLWSSLRPKINAQGQEWQFWVEWYDKALNGAKQDIPLLTKVALIDPADWDKGAGHVNALIAQIVQDHTRKPEPPRPTDVERSHIALILAAPEPAWQSAEFLRDQFDRIATAYIREIGCPNTDPPEIEPIRILSQTFDQMAHLLRSLKDRDQKIAELTQKLEVLEATNMKLVAIAQGQHSSRLNRIFDGAMGAVSAHMIIATFTQLGGPSVADGVSALWELINPSKPPSPPVSVLPPKIFET